VVGYVGGQAQGDRRRAFGYSLLFVLGLAITFTTLGAAAALLGTLFGNVGGIWFGLLGGLAVLMGLQLLGWVHLRLPFQITWRPSATGAWGALLLGLFFGVVSSPCATPVLVALLGLVAMRGEVAYGVSLLFVYALGHCVLMLAAGTFTGLVTAYAQSRGLTALSQRLRQGLGLLLAGAGIYLIWQV
jgi:cytochrome c biogenesis protein CcdA